VPAGAAPAATYAMVELEDGDAPQLGPFRSSSSLLLIGPLRARSEPFGGTDQCPLLGAKRHSFN